jgi:hypothetical protein
LQPCEFYGINFKYIEHIKFTQQNDWERTRWQTTWLVNCHTKKPYQPTDLIKFNWEGEQEQNGTFMTKKEIDEAKKRWNLDG